MALPSGYKRLKYITATGSQFIDTGRVPTTNTKIAMGFQLANPGTGNRCLFGVVGQFSFRWYGNSSRFRANGANSVDFPTGISGTDYHTVEKTATSCTLDGSETVSTTVGSPTLSLYVMAQHIATGASNYASGNFDVFRWYEGSTLVADYIACKSPDGIAGVWDDVNSVFLHSSGSAEFVAGPEVGDSGETTLPDGYTRLKYIESTGTQYIDTGFASTAGWIAELGWTFTENPYSEQDIIGSVYISGGTYYREYVLCRNNQWSLGHYSNYAYSGNAETAIEYNIKASTVSGNGYLIVNGEQIHKYTTTYKSHNAHNVYVFAMNVNGAEGFAKGRLSYLNLYNPSGNSVRGFIPVRRNSDGKLGLLDTLTNTFYPNAGTGEFVAGPAYEDTASGSDHKTNIGGADFEIEGGTAKVGGVLREIARGTTLVNGVGRDIEFAGTILVAITGSGDRYAGVIIDGTRYNSEIDVEVPMNTEAVFRVLSDSLSASDVAKITVDGKVVASMFGGSQDYSMMLNSDISVELSHNDAYGTINVTTS